MCNVFFCARYYWNLPWYIRYFKNSVYSICKMILWIQLLLFIFFPFFFDVQGFYVKNDEWYVFLNPLQMIVSYLLPCCCDLLQMIYKTKILIEIQWVNFTMTFSKGKKWFEFVFERTLKIFKKKKFVYIQVIFVDKFFMWTKNFYRPHDLFVSL